MTFKEVAEEWFESKMVTLSYGYKRSVMSAINHLCREFEKLAVLDIKEIQPKNIDKVISKLAACNPNTNRPSSKKTIKNIIQVANQIFEYAIENDIITKNPAKNKKAPKNAPTYSRQAINDEEKRLIINTPHRMQAPAMIMMFAGLRTGEVIPLEWSDIDFDNNTIFVSKSVSRVDTNKYAVKSGTKNGKNRIVTMPKILSNFLQTARKNSRSNFVAANMSGKLHTPSSWTQCWKSYVTELNHAADMSGKSKFHPDGVTKRIKITAHMLRHTYATMLYTSGVDVKTAAKLLGHSDEQTTISIYTHLEDSRKIYSISQFEEYISANF